MPTKQITHRELKEKYLSFFKSKGHAIIPSSSIVPENDPSGGLFVVAGMHPLIPNLMGQPHPAGKRLTNVQRCIRTGDIEEVGDKTHLTFFEMMGNWSLGDYFKKEVIPWTLEFLTSPQHLGFDKNKIWVTVFGGEGGIEKDTESIEIWKKAGIPAERIIPLGMEDNLWKVGEHGPCGPCTEVFIDMTGVPCKNGDKCIAGVCKCQRFFEIWNNVFMAYNKNGPKIEPLAQKNVDTGVGLERTLAALNRVSSVYETSVLAPIVDAIIKLSSQPEEKVRTDKSLMKAVYIIADHIRAITFILGDRCNIQPSNQGQGYVLRRLIRRSLRYLAPLGIKTSDWINTVRIVVDLYKEFYPELDENYTNIVKDIRLEAERFEQTLRKGLQFFEKAAVQIETEHGKTMSGEIAFRLYDTYGFPIEMTLEMAAERGITVDKKGYDQYFEQHKEKSKTATAAKSGLTENTAETTRYHTATHLLHAALRAVLGTHVVQKGSNITSERLRFDFAHPRPMTKEEIAKVEEWVQDKIDRKLPVKCETMTLEQAKAAGAIGLFEDKYAKEITVYSVGDASKEVCAGPHVKNTSELSGKFKIMSEQSSSAGIRRIKAQIV